LSGDATFAAKNYYSAGMNLFYEFKINDIASIRAINKAELHYDEDGLTLENVPNTFGNMYLGTQYINDITGLSFINKYNGIDYFVSILNNWDIYNYSNQGDDFDVSNYYRNESTNRGGELDVRLGFETKLITDWLTVRFSFCPMYYGYGEFVYYEANYGSAQSGTYRANTITFFPAYMMQAGFGIKFNGNNIDFIFGSSNLIDFRNENINNYNESNYYESIDETSKSSGLVFSVEYTTKFE
jgi:hypothetical protein